VLRREYCFMVPADAIGRRAIIIPPKPALNYINASRCSRTGLPRTCADAASSPWRRAFLPADGDDIIGERMRGQGEIMDALFEPDENFWELTNGIFGS
jgi:hypothetical protein